MSEGEGKAVSERKLAYFKKITKLFDDYQQVLIVGADNVGSRQMQKVRIDLRKYSAVILMGKNTMIRKAVREHAEKVPGLEKLLPLLKGNVGFIFCNGNLNEINEVLLKHRVEAPARAGTLAPVDVFVPAQLTTLEPTKTNFFQALGITTKITKGGIEILKDVHLIKVGAKVGSSESALLKMLNIQPFTYGLELTSVYDSGDVFPASMLKVTDDTILARFSASIKNVAAVSLGTHFPTLAAVPHLAARGFRNILSIGLGTNFKVAAVEKMLSAAAAAGPAPAAAAPAAAGGKAAAPAPAAKKEEPPAEEEEDAGGGFSLFD